MTIGISNSAIFFAIQTHLLFFSICIVEFTVLLTPNAGAVATPNSNSSILLGSTYFLNSSMTIGISTLAICFAIHPQILFSICIIEFTVLLTPNAGAVATPNSNSSILLGSQYFLNASMTIGISTLAICFAIQFDTPFSICIVEFTVLLRPNAVAKPFSNFSICC
uniref:Uncharacterized protein n=1 Tax=Cacopsylla melanoneura TaxID=428564 RepID=A0A8D8Z9P0_9HEMI